MTPFIVAFVIALPLLAILIFIVLAVVSNCFKKPMLCWKNKASSKLVKSHEVTTSHVNDQTAEASLHPKSKLSLSQAQEMDEESLDSVNEAY